MKRISLLNTLSGWEEKFTLSPEKQRYTFYKTGMMKKGQEVNYVEDDAKLYYSEATLTVHFNDKLYTRSSDKRGFTFDKKSGKVATWFKRDVKDLRHLGLLFKALGHEWVNNEKILTIGITKTQLQNILAGKITNPTEFCRKFISGNRLKGLSPEVLRKQIKGFTDHFGDDHNVNKHMLLRRAHIYHSLDHYFEKAEDKKFGTSSIMMDMEQQALVLGRKINALWSEARMKEEHTLWTRDIMKMELEDMVDEVYIDPEIVPAFPPGYEVISSKKRLFQEGTEMHHCIYSNYEHKIHSHTYLAIAYKDKTYRATLGLRVHNEMDLITREMKPALCIEQAYGPRNKELPKELVEQFKRDLLENQELHTWLYDYFTRPRAGRPVTIQNACLGELQAREVELDFF